MFIIKKNYYLYIENLTDLNINLLKTNQKIIIILRNVSKCVIINTTTTKKNIKLNIF